MTETEKLDAILADEANDENVIENFSPESPHENLQQPNNLVDDEYDKIQDEILEDRKINPNKYLRHDVRTGRSLDEIEDDKHFAEKRGLTRIGQRIQDTAELREGWITINKDVLGERALFYPDDWEFKIRPATVEAIRNWSTINEDDINAIDNVFNEVLKSCLSISTVDGPKPWGNIRSWDRFFFLLLIREYTFLHGEKEIKYEEPCPECDNNVEFKLTSSSLMFEFPDAEVMPMFDRETMTWVIDPREYDLDADVMTFYLPTLEKDANIKEWLIRKVRQNQNAKIDQVFIKILPWMTPKISKDATISQRQIKELEMKYKSWDAETFSFIDDVIRNIVVQPLQKLVSTCPICGEEVTSTIRFPNNIRDLFNVTNKYKKFGTK